MHHHFNLRRIVAAAAAAAILICGGALACRADTVETNDGKTLSGKIVDQTAAGVTVEIRTEGMTFRRKVPMARVKQITRDAAEGPGYCAVPLIGDVGTDITGDALTRALSEARKANPKFIVLVVDSGGGSGREM